VCSVYAQCRERDAAFQGASRRPLERQTHRTRLLAACQRTNSVYHAPCSLVVSSSGNAELSAVQIAPLAGFRGQPVLAVGERLPLLAGFLAACLLTASGGRHLPRRANYTWRQRAWPQLACRPAITRLQGKSNGYPGMGPDEPAVAARVVAVRDVTVTGTGLGAMACGPWHGQIPMMMLPLQSRTARPGQPAARWCAGEAVPPAGRPLGVQAWQRLLGARRWARAGLGRAARLKYRNARSRRCSRTGASQAQRCEQNWHLLALRAPPG